MLVKMVLRYYFGYYIVSLFLQKFNYKYFFFWKYVV